MDIRRVHGYTHESLIGHPIAMDNINGYKIVIPHGLGLPPEYNYSALVNILATVLIPGV